MAWAITLYPNYGTIQFLYNRLRKRWQRVEIAEEFYPYHHYHAMVKDSKYPKEDYTAVLKALNRIPHTKAPHKVHLSAVEDEKLYKSYIEKEHNTVLSNIESGDNRVYQQLKYERIVNQVQTEIETNQEGQPTNNIVV